MRPKHRHTRLTGVSQHSATRELSPTAEDMDMNSKLRQLIANLAKANGKPDMAGDAGELFARKWFERERIEYFKLPQSIATKPVSLVRCGGKRPDFGIELSADEAVFVDAKFHTTNGGIEFRMKISEIAAYRAFQCWMKDDEATVDTIDILFMIFPKEMNGDKFVWILLDEIEQGSDTTLGGEPAKSIPLTGRDYAWFDYENTPDKNDSRTNAFGLWRYALEYLTSASVLAVNSEQEKHVLVHADATYQCTCQGLELAFKSYMRARGTDLRHLRRLSHPIGRSMKLAVDLGLPALSPGHVAAIVLADQLYSTHELRYIVTGAKEYPALGTLLAAGVEALDASASAVSQAEAGDDRFVARMRTDISKIRPLAIAH